MGAPPAATTARGAVNPVGASLCFRAGVAQGSLGDLRPPAETSHLPKISLKKQNKETIADKELF